MEFPRRKCDPVNARTMRPVASFAKSSTPRHPYPRAVAISTNTLAPYHASPVLCRLDFGQPRALSAAEFRLVAPAALREYDFPPPMTRSADLGRPGLRRTCPGGAIDFNPSPNPNIESAGD